jgi:hypothetical protein
LSAASREPHSGDSARLRSVASQQRLRLRQPVRPPGRWQRGVASARRWLHIILSWGGWPRLAAIATALTAVAALWFSAKSLGSTEKQYALSEQGQVTDRFTKAVEQLGSEKTDVRLGGIYSLERLARDSKADQPTIIEVLSAYVRANAPADLDPTQRGHCGRDEYSVMPIDVQAVMTVIGRRDQEADGPYVDVAGVHRRLAIVDLSQSCLVGVLVFPAHLENAVLREADLRRAILPNSDLRKAIMWAATLTSANLRYADLSDVDLTYADLDDADLRGAKLSGADLSQATITDANLNGILYDPSTKWPNGFTPPPSRPAK